VVGVGVLEEAGTNLRVLGGWREYPTNTWSFEVISYILEAGIA
jgi:hypothetical protein